MTTAAASTDFWALVGLHGLSLADVASLWLHFSLLSLLAVGGAIATAPDMQRWLVVDQGWLSAGQFTASVAIAQAAPGPNLLFVALLGWNVAGVAGAAATMIGIVLPSSVLALAAGRYGRRRAQSLQVRAFTAGLTPLTLGLLAATGWVLFSPTRHNPAAAMLLLACLVASVRLKTGPMWLILAGAVLGMLGWV